uniref:Putative secreted peptide n=1 Tax=Anopheles braziliensis TaxID=58242 RepID=A0A2M3ZTK1_9DIPT
MFFSMPSTGGTCLMLLLARSSVAKRFSAPNPVSEASISSIRLPLASSISSPFSSYTHGDRHRSWLLTTFSSRSVTSSPITSGSSSSKLLDRLR